HRCWTADHQYVIVGAKTGKASGHFLKPILTVLSDEDHQGLAAGAFDVVREREAAGADIPANHFLQILFVVGSFIPGQGGNTRYIFVKACNWQSKIGQAGRNNRRQIAGSVYRVVHEASWGLGEPGKRALSGETVLISCMLCFKGLQRAE